MIIKRLINKYDSVVVLDNAAFNKIASERFIVETSNHKNRAPLSESHQLKEDYWFSVSYSSLSVSKVYHCLSSNHKLTHQKKIIKNAILLRYKDLNKSMRITLRASKWHLEVSHHQNPHLDEATFACIHLSLRSISISVPLVSLFFSWMKRSGQSVLFIRFLSISSAEKNCRDLSWIL